VAAVQAVAAAGKCCVLDIDVQGARQVRAARLPALFVFVAPPSLEELERRLRGRGTEAEAAVATRLANAAEEMASAGEVGLYDAVIVNGELEACLGELRALAARARAGEGGAAPAAGAAAAAGGAVAVGAAPGSGGGRAQPDSAAGSLSGWLGSPRGPGSPPGPAGGGGLERWRGRVALVTGAGGAVGRELALALAAAGARVVAVSRGRAALEALQAEAAAAGAPPADFLAVACDVTKEAEVAALPRIVARRWPGAGVDALVGAAAAPAAAPGGASAALAGGATPAWVDAVSVDLLGAALVAREVVTDMRRRGAWGHVVYISCCADEAAGGRGGGAGASGSAAGMRGVAKGAVRAMAAGLRAEARAEGAPLRVSCVVPGRVGPGALAPRDVAAAAAWCLAAPPHVDVSEVVLRALG
jgi:NAD(P)-dependent dehydrogenase (short-subunit alcohol dehydrogenase family)